MTADRCTAQPHPSSTPCSLMPSLSVERVLRFASLCCACLLFAIFAELGAMQSGRIARSAPEFAGARLDKLYRIRCPRPPALAPPAFVLAY
jgi:hypothetical protein